MFDCETSPTHTHVALVFARTHSFPPLPAGYLYDHGHLARATCCRLVHREPDVRGDLPPPFRVNHPRLGRVTAYDPPRETEKTKAMSVNWCAGDTAAEVIDGTKGYLVDRCGTSSFLWNLVWGRAPVHPHVIVTPKFCAEDVNVGAPPTFKGAGLSYSLNIQMVNQTEPAASAAFMNT